MTGAEGEIGDPRDGETASDSESSSLEIHPDSPQYHNLAPFILFDREDYLNIFNAAPAHMAVEDGQGKTRNNGQHSPRRAQMASLEEQL
jgi:hypothetical protein